VNRIGFSQRLELRQSQALVMTPQLQQAIKMLQLSNLELADYVNAEIEQNPLLEPGEGDGEDGAHPSESSGGGANGTEPNGAVAAEPAAAAETRTDFPDGGEQWDASAGSDGDGKADFGGDTQPWRTRNGSIDVDDLPGLDQAAARPRTLRTSAIAARNSLRCGCFT